MEFLFRSALLSSIFSAMLSSFAFAWPPTFGTEFNFSNYELEVAYRNRLGGGRPGPEEEQAAIDFKDMVLKRCGDDCHAVPHKGKWGQEFEILFKDSWSFNISWDPACVEIQTKPQTSSEIAKYEAKIQQFIFNTGRDAGVVPQVTDHLLLGGLAENTAHLNIGVRSAFEDSPNSLLRFYSDYGNRPALAMGVFGETKLNAPGISHLFPRQRNALQKMVFSANQGKKYSLQEIGDGINFDIHTSSPMHSFNASDGRHYQAMSVKKLIGLDKKEADQPVEIRPVRQPSTAREYTLMTQLHEKRIEHLKGMTDPIVYTERAVSSADSDVRVGAAHAYSYVEEIGEDWKKYEVIFSPEIRKQLATGNVQRFFSGDIHWSSKDDLFLFENVFKKDFAISRWMEEGYVKALSHSEIPSELMIKSLNELGKRRKGNPAVEKSSLRILRKLKEVPHIKNSPDFRKLILEGERVLDPPPSALSEFARCIGRIFR